MVSIEAQEIEGETIDLSCLDGDGAHRIVRSRLRRCEIILPAEKRAFLFAACSFDDCRFRAKKL
jgi:hypothetical protein